MKKLIRLLFVLLLLTCTTDVPNWKLGIQTYTFHKFTLVEALKKAKELKLNYAEAYFGQTLGNGFADSLYLDYTLDRETRALIKDLFAENGVKLYSLGVAMYSTEQEWTRFFDFARDMEVPNVSCEPQLEHLDLVERLAINHNINVAIHNHPGSSTYADPAVLIGALKGRNKRMGVCADPGHWKREGKRPVEILKQFEGRIKVIHIKDLSASMEDTVWGSGVLEVNELIRELLKQHFDGLMAIEFENFGVNQMNDIKASLDYYKSLIR